MRIVTQLIVPVICMTAMTVLGQGAANVGKTVEELANYIHIGSSVTADTRDDKNQKLTLVKTTSDQDKDMGFDGVMRLTVELTGNTGEVWYGQIMKPQAKRRPDYIGKDTWEFTVPHSGLKYPEMVYALEYGYQVTNKAFVVVGRDARKCESGDEIMARNKDSKNEIKLTAKTRAEHETDVADDDSAE